VISADTALLDIGKLTSDARTLWVQARSISRRVLNIPSPRIKRRLH
jgi:hypothetical protein